MSCKDCDSERQRSEFNLEAWAAERQRRESVERAWVMVEIDRSYDRDPSVTEIPDAVAKMFLKHRADPVGECDRCGKRAPLVKDTDDNGCWTRQTCAWDSGCEGKP